MSDNSLPKNDFNFNPGSLGIPSVEVKSANKQYQLLNTLASPLHQYENANLELEKIREIAFKMWPTELKLTVVHSATTLTTLLSYVLALKNKDKVTVLTSSHEHKGGIKSFEKLSDYYNICYFTDDELHSKQLFIKAIERHQPEICFLSHVMFDTGWILPISEYGEIIKKNIPKALFIIDIAQSLGLVELPETKFIDVMFGSTHKWLMGPQGSGLLWTSEYFRGKVDSIYLEDEDENSGFAISGGQDFSTYPQIFQSIKLYEKNGLINIQEVVASFSNIFWSNVQPVFINYGINAQRVNGFSKFECAPFLVICFEKYDPYALYKRMSQSGLHVKCIKNCNIYNNKYHLLRIGIPYFESEERVKIAVEILKDCLSVISKD